MTRFSIYSNSNQDIILKDEWISVEKHIKQMELLKSILEKPKKKQNNKYEWSDKDALDRIIRTINYYKNLENETNTNV